VADDLTNQLLDLIGELLIENRAYKSSVKALEQLLPIEQRRVGEVVSAAIANPDLRATIEKLIDQLRSQSREEAIQYLTSLVRRG
jgi:hypothetical protein